VTVPRVAPGTRAEVGLPNWLFARLSGRVTGTEPPNLFLTLGRHRRLFLAWAHFGGRLMPGGRLPRRETEMVILRVAHLRSCEYELHHHRRLAARSGLEEREMSDVLEDPTAGSWTPRERAVLAAVDELHATEDLADPTWAALRQHLDEAQAIELVLLVGHYRMLATAIRTLRIATDQPRRRG
jgi:AhpD family alkylhydroperoxidase